MGLVIADDPSTQDERDLLAALRMDERLRLWAWVADHGRFYPPAPLADDWMRNEPRYCYDNSLEVAQENDDLSYIEGFAYSAQFAVPIHHAWNAEPDGRVVDTTWPVPGLAYRGVELDLELVAAARDAEESALVWGLTTGALA